MAEYLDKTGLTYLWSKIKAKFDAKADKTELNAKADKTALNAKADKKETDALGKRIDNLILSSGTESSAEVVDARNGYDGTTYDTLGTAIRSQVSELKGDLVNLNSSIGNNIIPIQHYINNKIVNGSGYHDADGWYATNDYIDISGHSKLVTNSTVFFVVYNANKVVIDNGTLTTGVKYVKDAYLELGLTSDARYIKFAISGTALTSTHAYIALDEYRYKNDFTINSLSNYIDNNVLKNVEWLSGYYIQGDGLHPNEEYYTSDYIYCHGKNNVILSNPCFFVCYNERGVVTDNGVSSNIPIDNRTYTIRISASAPLYQYVKMSFGDYKNNLSERTKIYVGQGRGYTNLLQAIRDAHSKGKCDIYVSSGTYNVLEELTEMGVDITQTGYEGVFIGNDTNIYAETGATLVCNYEQVSQASYNFSVLNCDDSDFLIENLTIKAKNIRYCVHDDPNTTDRSYTHKFIDCHMEIDNTYNDYWKQGTCIGAGIGHKGYVVVDGGYYKGRYLDNGQSTINYHGDSTSGRTDSDCNLVIKNVYFDGFCTCGVTKYGASEILSKAYISNCSMYSDIIFDTEEGDTGGWILKAWNNEIRSNQIKQTLESK